MWNSHAASSKTRERGTTWKAPITSIDLKESPKPHNEVSSVRLKLILIRSTPLTQGNWRCHRCADSSSENDNRDFWSPSRLGGAHASEHRGCEQQVALSHSTKSREYAYDRPLRRHRAAHRPNHPSRMRKLPATSPPKTFRLPGASRGSGPGMSPSRRWRTSRRSASNI